jgi:putative DNA-invertase from lambdoid prophage Rac
MLDLNPKKIKHPTVVLYARVSTSDQDCALQLDALRHWCLSRSEAQARLTPSDRDGIDWSQWVEKVDQGISGAKSSRPAANWIEDSVRDGSVKVVVVWKMDRLSRSLVDFFRRVDEMNRRGVRFIAIQDNIDTDKSTPVGNLLMHVMAAFAQFEREVIRERTLAGMAVARKSGKKIGRPKAVFDRAGMVKLRDQDPVKWSWAELSAKYKQPKSSLQRVYSELKRTERGMKGAA